MKASRYFKVIRFLLTAIAILVPTLLLGALFPLITAVWSNRTGAVGRGVGEAYGANALGTIAGSAIGGLFILDWLGIAGSLYLASAVSMLGGSVVLVYVQSPPLHPVSMGSDSCHRSDVFRLDSDLARMGSRHYADGSVPPFRSILR